MKTVNENTPLPELVAMLGGRMSGPHETLRSIWNTCPYGQKLSHEGFHALGEHMWNAARMSILRFHYYYKGDFYALSLVEAKAEFDKWVERTQADSHAWNETQETEARYWDNASVSTCHPPRTI